MKRFHLTCETEITRNQFAKSQSLAEKKTTSKLVARNLEKFPLVLWSWCRSLFKVLAPASTKSVCAALTAGQAIHLISGSNEAFVLATVVVFLVAHLGCNDDCCSTSRRVPTL